MIPVRRVCAFYSIGPHYAQMLARLREAYPDALIDAWIPPGLTLPDDARNMPVEIVQTEPKQYSPRNVATCGRLVQQIRARRYDVFAVMFYSAQLRLLAVLSGAPFLLHGTPRGKLVPLPCSIARVGLDLLYANLRGRLHYLKVWLAVRLLRVKRVL